MRSRASRVLSILAGMAGALLGTSGALAGAMPIPVYSTGLTPGGGMLAPGGTADGNYFLTLAPPGFTLGAPAFVVDPLPAAWAPNTTTSQWINPDGLGSTIGTYHPGGTYAYTTFFGLTGFIPTSTSIILEWIADDNFVVPGAVSLNGFVVPGSSPPANGWTSTSWTTVTVSTMTLPAAAFVSGMNALTFTVTNNQTMPSPTGPTGLQVNILSATAMPVPEPGSVAVLLLGAPLLLRQRRDR